MGWVASGALHLCRVHGWRVPPAGYVHKQETANFNYATVRMDMDEREGVSAFYKDGNGAIYHTYSSYARGIDLLNTTYNFLDLTAKGRDENPDRPQDWVRYHDRYKT